MVCVNSMIIRIKRHSLSTEHILLLELYRKKKHSRNYTVYSSVYIQIYYSRNKLFLFSRSESASRVNNSVKSVRTSLAVIYTYYIICVLLM